ncbi:hypothetical protein GCM10007036_17600 [Alsobacter metallidurans]|uniref:Antitoxin VapB n=1 Tax=Alsobacter metallidurans TaxID=340221 RepID=A0A917MHB3_9HYPH|nr:type II toxin-antitoxin system VapB family antitoxin [Alsobacter metallidurans]GGH16696.1 hypothetical protein GCM10007036_17600 [Alsobacter metallidurans]
MSAPLNIRNPRARELARELAERRRISITDAVVGALQAELARERAETPLARRLGDIGARSCAKAGPNRRDLSEEERDALWTR